MAFLPSCFAALSYLFGSRCSRPPLIGSKISVIMSTKTLLATRSFFSYYFLPINTKLGCRFERSIRRSRSNPRMAKRALQHRVIILLTRAWKPPMSSSRRFSCLFSTTPQVLSVRGHEGDGISQRAQSSGNSSECSNNLGNDGKGR